MPNGQGGLSNEKEFRAGRKGMAWEVVGTPIERPVGVRGARCVVGWICKRQIADGRLVEKPC